MNSFLYSLIVSIGSGFVSYYIIRASLVGYLWLTNTQLLSHQRYLIHEYSGLVFLGGTILGYVGLILYNKSSRLKGSSN